MFTAESWGSDAFGPLAWWGSHTSTIRLGTSIVQISARTPTACAMHALTLDHLSQGRFVLGLGVSGPQVVEGWYGAPFGKPLARTREYVDIVRQVLAREGPVTNPGPHHPLPYEGPGALGMGKPLKPITHPFRPDLPIWLGAEGPKNVALAAEIADGWLPIYYAPKVGGMYDGWLAEGFARRPEGVRPASFEIAANCSVVVTDDVDAALDAMRPGLGLLHRRDGRPRHELPQAGLRPHGVRGGGRADPGPVPRGSARRGHRRGPAVAWRPTSPSSAPASRSATSSPAWEEAGVTMLVVGGGGVDQLRRTAEVVLGA